MNDLNNMIPCVVFAYNRPRHFQRVLDALRTQGVGHLIVFVDGASNDRDLLGVEACRKVARAVDWIRPELHFDDENHGVSHLAIRVGEVLKRFPKAVFVEDDCLPMPGFYAFMTEALRHYAEEKTVFSVAGYQPIPPRFFRTYPWSAIATHRFICWGWGTWQDRWQTVEALLPNWTKVFDNLKNVPNIAGEDLALAAHQVLAGRTESWAVKVALLTLSRGMVHILPSRGLVKNIGVDEGAHRGQPEFRTRRRAMHNQNVSSSILKHISWPPQTVPDPSFAAEIQRFVREALYPTPTAAMKLRAFGEKVVAYVPQPFKRTARRLLGTLRSISRQNRQQAPLRLVNLGGVGDYSGRNSKPRALLSYVVHPFLVAPSDPMLNCPSPAVRANEMVKVLNELGYVVDLIDYQDDRFVPEQGYELFVGHGAVNFHHIAERLPKAKKIFFATGAHWRFYNRSLEERWRSFCVRHGPVVPPPTFMASEEPALTLADTIVGVGNEHTRNTYGDYPGVTMINNTVLPDHDFDPLDREFDSGRLHFLYYASKGGIGKGLDLVLEAFCGLDAELWVCTELTPAWRAFHGRLGQPPNVHLVGWVQPRGQRFRELARLCNYVILPSCSEGQSHSVVECMGHGLIPVVSRACGISVEDWGYWLEPCTVEGIREVVQRILSEPVRASRERAERMLEEVRTAYSEEVFRTYWREAVRALMNSPGKSPAVG